MYVCMSVCMYVCTKFVRRYLCYFHIHGIRAHAYMRTLTYIHAYAYAYAHASVHVHVYVYNLHYTSYAVNYSIFVSSFMCLYSL